MSWDWTEHGQSPLGQAEGWGAGEGVGALSSGCWSCWGGHRSRAPARAHLPGCPRQAYPGTVWHSAGWPSRLRGCAAGSPRDCLQGLGCSSLGSLEAVVPPVPPPGWPHATARSAVSGIPKPVSQCVPPANAVVPWHGRGPVGLQLGARRAGTASYSCRDKGRAMGSGWHEVGQGWVGLGLLGGPWLWRGLFPLSLLRGQQAWKMREALGALRAPVSWGARLPSVPLGPARDGGTARRHRARCGGEGSGEAAGELRAPPGAEPGPLAPGGWTTDGGGCGAVEGGRAVRARGACTESPSVQRAWGWARPPSPTRRGQEGHGAGSCWVAGLAGLRAEGPLRAGPGEGEPAAAASWGERGPRATR